MYINIYSVRDQQRFLLIPQKKSSKGFFFFIFYIFNWNFTQLGNGKTKQRRQRLSENYILHVLFDSRYKTNFVKKEKL